MGLRFRRKIKILPGVSLNIGKKGVSTSIGVRGAHITLGKNGTRTTLGIPGTGISYTSLTKSDTSLDADGLPYMRRCPYCNHMMRKRWDKCPACHEYLIQPTTVSIMRCPKCRKMYTGILPRFCGDCGERLSMANPEEYPKVLTPKMQKSLTSKGCIACPKCHQPIAKKRNLKYCDNCGARLPIPKMTFFEGVKLFATYFFLGIEGALVLIVLGFGFYLFMTLLMLGYFFV